MLSLPPQVSSAAHTPEEERNREGDQGHLCSITIHHSAKVRPCNLDSFTQPRKFAECEVSSSEEDVKQVYVKSPETKEKRSGRSTRCSEFVDKETASSFFAVLSLCSLFHSNPLPKPHYLLPPHTSPHPTFSPQPLP